MLWHLELNRRLLKLILSSGSRPAVVHNHGCESSPLACYLAEYWDVPLVSAVHVVDDLFDEAQGLSRPRGHDRFVQKALEVNGFTRCDWIIAPNDYIATRLSDLYPGSASRIAVIPHPRSENVVPKASWEHDAPLRALYVGRLISYKGILPLLQAVQMLKPDVDLHLTVVGDGPERDRVRALEQSTTKVEWIRHLSHHQLVSRYPSFDLAILPSTLETHSMVLHEAMQCGLPVITADVEPTRSLVTHEREAILVPVAMSEAGAQADPAAIAEAITQLAGSSSLRERYGRAARQRTMHQPDAEQYAELLDRTVT